MLGVALDELNRTDSQTFAAALGDVFEHSPWVAAAAYERRPFTTVPQQALFALNAPFMLEQAKALAAEAASGGAEPKTRIRTLYRRARACVCPVGWQWWRIEP